MSIIYNGNKIAGVYQEQIIPNADTINKGIIKIATQEEVNIGQDNTSAVTPLYLAQKQDKLTAGDNIEIKDGVITGTLKPDNNTAIKNADNTFTVIGQKTKSNTIKIDWEGTTAEYEQAWLNGNIEPNWYCYITDDEAFVDYSDVEITTSENDTLPLGYSLYQGNGSQPSVAWLASNGQWNDGNIYTTFYNYYVSKIGDSFGAGSVVLISADYTDYDLVINDVDMSFRLPLLNGSETLPSTQNYNYTIPTANQQVYTAIKNGFIQAHATSSATNQYLRITNKETGEIDEKQPPVSGAGFAVNVWVNKGDTFAISSTNIAIVKKVTLNVAQGNGTLYFKVDNAVQNLELLNVGEITESLSNKLDTNSVKAYVTETFQDGTSWYRVYSDGWCEQGGVIEADSDTTPNGSITFLKPFRDTSYSIIATSACFANGHGCIINYDNRNNIDTKKNNSIKFIGIDSTHYVYSISYSWQASGYIQ